MLYYSAIFFIISLISALFGFSDIAPSVAIIAQLLCVIFSILTVVAFAAGVISKPKEELNDGLFDPLLMD